MRKGNLTKGAAVMEMHDYTVIKIEGDYATLRDIESGNEIFIALALLPPGTDIGTRLHEEMFQYTVIE